MYKKILVPIDGSNCSMGGLLEAIKVAKAQDAGVRLVHVVNELLGLDSGLGAFTYVAQLMEAQRESGKTTLKTCEAIAAAHGIKVDKTMLEQFGGRAADSIVEQAKLWPADLIVMGTHGRRGVSRLVLGSDAELVLRAAPCPVLMVRNGSDK